MKKKSRVKADHAGEKKKSLDITFVSCSSDSDAVLLNSVDLFQTKGRLNQIALIQKITLTLRKSIKYNV